MIRVFFVALVILAGAVFMFPDATYVEAAWTKMSTSFDATPPNCVGQGEFIEVTWINYDNGDAEAYKHKALHSGGSTWSGYILLDPDEQGVTQTNTATNDVYWVELYSTDNSQALVQLTGDNCL
jgi:hypothetical protein